MDLVYTIVGYGMEILNEIGHGLREKTYERALLVDLRQNNISFTQQHAYKISYKGERIDDYIPDILIEDQIIVEIKVAESIANEHIGQVINYLKISGCELGLIMNFKYPKLQWKRVILSETADGRK